MRKVLYPVFAVFFMFALGYGLLAEAWVLAALALIGVVGTLVYRNQLTGD